MRRVLLAITCALTWHAPTAAQPETLAIGDELPSWTTVDMRTNQSLRLRKLPGEAFVAVLVDPQCPYVRHYAATLKGLQKLYPAARVGWALVDPVSSESDSLRQRQWLARQKLRGAYLSDPDQNLAKTLGLDKTPAVAVFVRQPTGWQLYYRGGLDHDLTDGTGSFLRMALDSALSGQVVGTAERRATGCRIAKVSQWQD